MSINSSLSNALSGLTAAARAADVVSSNIANAMTEGYARRELDLSARSPSGVQVDGTRRIIDQALLTDKRLAFASAGGASVTADFMRRLESVIGTPDQAGSLSAKVAVFESALVEAASRPEAESRLVNVLTSATDVSNQFNIISNDIQAARAQADRQIGQDVAMLNDSLKMIESLNSQIALANVGGRDASALYDQRQQLVDKVSDIVPMKEVARERGQIALITSGGAVLLDGRAAQVQFTPAGVISADMTMASGALSGLTLNGLPADRSLAGGSLSANFQVRDELTVAAQANVDGLARDLMVRMSSAAADPTLNGTPGLFTDLGNGFDPAEEAGLASRLRINAAADPDQGGALWHLRDGLGAIAPGSVGNARLFLSMAEALNKPSAAASGGYGTAPTSFSGLAAEFLSLAGSGRQSAETRASFAAARADGLRLAEAANGVDSDQELQRLMLIEQAYAANARVIQTMDDMLQTLLRI